MDKMDLKTEPPVALPGANLLPKVAKPVFIVPMTGLWPVMGTYLGSRGSIPWPPEAFSLARNRYFLGRPYLCTKVPFRYSAKA